MARNLTLTVLAALLTFASLSCSKGQSNDTEPSTIPNFVYSYVVDHAGNVFDCALNSTTGAFSNCTISNGGASFTAPEAVGLSLVSASVYVADGAGHVYLCSVNTANAQLSSCATSDAGQGAWKPWDIFVAEVNNSQIIYVVDNRAGSGNVWLCQVDQSSGALTSCSQSNGGATFNSPSRISFGITNSAVFAYVTDPAAGDVYACSVSQTTGALSSCAVSNGGVSGWAPTGIYLMTYNGSTDYAYVTDGTNGNVYVCSVNASTGSLSSCTVNNGGATGWLPTMFSIAYESGTYFADVSDQHGNVYLCNLNQSNGQLSGCAVSNGGGSYTAPDFVFSF